MHETFHRKQTCCGKLGRHFIRRIWNVEEKNTKVGCPIWESELVNHVKKVNCYRYMRGTRNNSRHMIILDPDMLKWLRLGVSRVGPVSAALRRRHGVLCCAQSVEGPIGSAFLTRSTSLILKSKFFVLRRA